METDNEDIGARAEHEILIYFYFFIHFLRCFVPLPWG